MKVRKSVFLAEIPVSTLAYGSVVRAKGLVKAHSGILVQSGPEAVESLKRSIRVRAHSSIG